MELGAGPGPGIGAVQDRATGGGDRQAEENLPAGGQVRGRYPRQRDGSAEEDAPQQFAEAQVEGDGEADPGEGQGGSEAHPRGSPGAGDGGFENPAKRLGQSEKRSQDGQGEADLTGPGRVRPRIQGQQEGTRDQTQEPEGFVRGGKSRGPGDRQGQGRGEPGPGPGAGPVSAGPAEAEGDDQEDQGERADRSRNERRFRSRSRRSMREHPGDADQGEGHGGAGAGRPEEPPQRAGTGGGGDGRSGGLGRHDSGPSGEGPLGWPFDRIPS